MPDLLRRVAALTVLSAVGLALLAPLSARSALPDVASDVGPPRAGVSLPRTDLAFAFDRGPAADRSAPMRLVSAVQPAAAVPEQLHAAALPTPPTAPMEATLVSLAPPPAAPIVAAPPPGDSVAGRASWYCHKVGTCPAGFTPADAFVALPGALGGAGGQGVIDHVTVCADRCVVLPVVDFCACFWGTAQQRVADISATAWALLTDRPRSAGVISVTVHFGG